MTLEAAYNAPLTRVANGPFINGVFSAAVRNVPIGDDNNSSYSHDTADCKREACGTSSSSKQRKEETRAELGVMLRYCKREREGVD